LPFALERKKVVEKMSFFQKMMLRKTKREKPLQKRFMDQ
tara:strand:- start:1757 stop:1873 length:117 start_codon:yes stop_codon:yes gene_type:complete